MHNDQTPCMRCGKVLKTVDIDTLSVGDFIFLLCRDCRKHMMFKVSSRFGVTKLLAAWQSLDKQNSEE